jgi:hypothetical protein
MINPASIDDIAEKLPKTATLAEVIDKVNAIVETISPPENQE